MTSDVIGTIVRDLLKSEIWFADKPIWVPTDEIREEDEGVIVGVESMEEVVKGNNTWHAHVVIGYRQRWGDDEVCHQRWSAGELGRAVMGAMREFKTFAGCRDGYAWRGLSAYFGSVQAQTEDSWLVCRMEIDLFMQF